MLADLFQKSLMVHRPADTNGAADLRRGESIHSMTTEEWQQQYEADGYVDLWVQEEFNSGSRLVVSPLDTWLMLHAVTTCLPCACISTTISSSSLEAHAQHLHLGSAQQL